MKIKIMTGMMSLLMACAMTTSCSDDNDANINTTPIISSVTTGDATVTSVSATIPGSIQDLSSQSSSAYDAGIVYSTSKDNVKSGTEAAATLGTDGAFSVEITGLQKNVTYYYATFVRLQDKVSYYGEVKSFITSNASVTTAEATGLKANEATIGGQLSEVSSLPSNATLTCGVKMSSSAENVSNGLEIDYDNVSAAKSGSAYTINKMGLLQNKKYYYQAFMKLNNSYIYGEVKSFTTPDYQTEFVDLGLGILWAKTNVGAISEEQIGGLYGFGDATGLKMLTTDTYASADVSGSANDIAMATGYGRMPSSAEVKQLLSKCTFKDSTVNSVAGVRVTGPNGNAIFLPKGGYRNGSTVKESGTSAYYWTGSVNPNSTEYGTTFNVKSGSQSLGNAQAYQGLCVRAVKATKVAFDNSKLQMVVNGGDLRLELYNEYGGTKSNPGLDPTKFLFTKKMFVNFTLAGIPAGTAPFTASLGFADASWSPSNWGENKGSVQVNGDGTYTVEVDVTEAASGVIVFVIDLKGQASLLGKVDGYINSIIIDTDNTVGECNAMSEKIDNSKVLKGDIEGKGNYRFEIYNQWGSGSAKNPPFDASVLTFSNNLVVNFTVSGLGKLSKSYRAHVMYADNSWAVSNWSVDTQGYAEVTGDGTYEVKLNTGGATAVAPPYVFTLDINGLCSDVPAANINGKINFIAFK